MTRSAVFTALADENRRLVLDRLLARNGQTLVELCAGQRITRQAVSKHLAVLEAAGLVLSVRTGRQKRHYLNPVPLHAEALRWLNRFNAAEMGLLAEAVEPRKKAGH